MPAEIEIGSGDLIASEAEALVNPVNCAGVMGKGLSFAFKTRFPKAFIGYAKACKDGEVMPGRIFVFDTGDRRILHFPTKRSFRDVSRIEDIDSGLVALVSEIESRGIRSIAVPAIGCGEGELDWDVVRPRIEAALLPLDGLRVVLYEPA